jgi:hypothetical protein
MASEALRMRGHVYQCAECAYTGDRRQFRTPYVMRHAVLDDVPYYCKECELRFTDMRAFKRHSKAKQTEVDADLDGADYAIMSKRDSMAYYTTSGRGGSPRGDTVKGSTSKRKVSSEGTEGVPCKFFRTPDKGSATWTPRTVKLPEMVTQKTRPVVQVVVCSPETVNQKSPQTRDEKSRATVGKVVSPARVDAKVVSPAGVGAKGVGARVVFSARVDAKVVSPAEVGCQVRRLSGEVRRLPAASVRAKPTLDLEAKLPSQTEVGEARRSRTDHTRDLFGTDSEDSECEGCSTSSSSSAHSDSEGEMSPGERRQAHEDDDTMAMISVMDIPTESRIVEELDHDVSVREQVPTDEKGSSGSPNFDDMREMMENIISRSIHDTVEAVTSAIIVGVKMNAPVITVDQGPIISMLMETNGNLGLLAASIEGQTAACTKQDQPLTKAIERLTDSMEGFRRERARLSETVERHSKLVESVGPKFMGEFAVLRTMFRTVTDGQEILSKNMAHQSLAFQTVTQKLTGLIEDDRRKGTVPSLVRKILELSPVKATVPEKILGINSAPLSMAVPTPKPVGAPRRAPTCSLAKRPPATAQGCTRGRVESRISVLSKPLGRARRSQDTFMSPVRPGFAEMMESIRKNNPHKREHADVQLAKK